MNKTTTYKVVKRVVTGVVGLSVTYAVSNALVNNTTPENKLQTVEAAIGGAAVGITVASIVERKLSDWMDDTFEALETA